MERHRGDRSGDRGSDRDGGGGGGGGARNSRMQSRWSSGSPTGQQHRYPNNTRGGGGSAGGTGGGFSEGFSGASGGRHHPYRHPDDYPPSDGGGGGGGPGFCGGSAGFGSGSMPPGPRSGGGGGRFMGRGGSPDYNNEGNNFAKLFIGSVPRTATEEEIRPLFEEHGEVIEVALIKDKRTGQQQGCCFIKYASLEEAERAIRALHNQYTLPGGSAPIQVRFADGERERLVEDKLFVGSLNRQATEKEIEEIFNPYGRVEDVYIMRDEMKQSRGCGFVKFSNRDMAMAAMNALHGVYVMRGCEQPLIVRFADPKRPRPGEARGGPALGGPGFGPRSQAPFGARPPPNLGDPIGGRIPPTGWQPPSQNTMGPSSKSGADGFGNNFSDKGAGMSVSSASAESLGALGVMNGSLSLFPGKGFPMGQGAANQQTSPAQKPLTSPQHMPPMLQLQNAQQNILSQSQAQPFSLPQFGHLQGSQSIGLQSNPVLASQHLFGMGGQIAASQPLIQQNASVPPLQSPLGGLQQQLALPGLANQQQLPAASITQLLQQPIQQLPSQLSQALLQHQAQALQSSYQSSQQAISQLQQQLQSMQQSSLNQQQGSQAAKLQQAVKQQQMQWSGLAPQSAPSSSAGSSDAVVASASSATPSLSAVAQSAVPLTCNWSEHTSPDGYKYYYNSATRESKWEKPDELTLFEQHQQQQKLLLFQQQQQKLAGQQLQSLSQTQPHAQLLPNQQPSQMQQVQTQMQLNQQAQMQILQPNLSYQASGVAGHQNIPVIPSVTDPSRVQQGILASQEWMWKNKPAGT